MGRAGYTMVEIAVGTLLTAVIAGSVFSLALTAKRSSGKALRKMIADQASRQLAEQLQYYVKSGSYLTSDTALSGPLGAGTAGWSLGTDVTDSCGANCYALAVGTHELTGYLPDWFENEPFNARIGYWVANISSLEGGALHVGTTVQWNEL